MLRRFPQQQFAQLQEGGNLYTTTIYVLVSAIQRIAREIKLPAGTKLYRGLGGDKKLPSYFFKSDDKGCRGMVEWAFMSTTQDKNVALSYSGIREGKPYPIIFEFVAGAVDRGAVITQFSQYPGEQECLFLPCSFLEPQGGEAIEVTKAGIVGKIHIRLNMNMKARTCDDLINQKKEMHVSSFSYLVRELERELGELLASDEVKQRAKNDLSLVFESDEKGLKEFVTDIIEECDALLQIHNISGLGYS